MGMGLTQVPEDLSGGSKARPTRDTDNLTAIYEPIVYKMWVPRHLTAYRPPRPVTGIALLSFFFFLHFLTNEMIY
jgi:hypothetical protein